jgi:hypothetical protein
MFGCHFNIRYGCSSLSKVASFKSVLSLGVVSDFSSVRERELTHHVDDRRSEC